LVEVPSGNRVVVDTQTIVARPSTSGPRTPDRVATRC
jgi:hypothetical protein